MSVSKSATYRVFFMYLLMSFYCFGAAMVNEFVEYYSWPEAGRLMQQGFAEWLTASSEMRIPVLVLPMVINTLLAFSLLRYLPAVAPRWALWIILCCHVAAWTSTFMFQLPLEMRLGKDEFSPELMQQLLTTDWIRKMAFLIEMPLVIYLGVKVFLIPFSQRAGHNSLV
jgi:hypothetical protein